MTAESSPPGHPPANTGYVDTTGTSSGISSYTAIATNPSGQTVATVTTADTKAVLTGVSNGTNYTVTVTATNPIGTSAAASAGNISPVAVSGGPSAYVGEINKLANAQNTLTTGAAASTQDAVTAVGGTTTTTSDLGTTATTFEQSHDTMANAAEQHSGDTTTLTNSLVVPSADGKTAAVYATATTTGTLTDTSTGSTVTIPTTDVEDVAYTLTTGATPTVTANADENAIVAPLTTAAPATALSPADAAPGDSSQAFTTDPNTGLLKAPDGTVATPSVFHASRGATSYHSANLAATANWADSWYWRSIGSPWSQDCTDFTSHALRYGGGLPMRSGFYGSATLNNWYFYGSRNYSGSWSLAGYDALWQQAQGSPIWTSLSWPASPQRGDIVYANWYGTGFGRGIGHAGIVSRVIGKNLIIDQHDGRGQDTLYWTPLRGIHGVWVTQRSDQFWIVSPGERY